MRFCNWLRLVNMRLRLARTSLQLEKQASVAATCGLAARRQIPRLENMLLRLKKRLANMLLQLANTVLQLENMFQQLANTVLQLAAAAKYAYAAGKFGSAAGCDWQVCFCDWQIRFCNWKNKLLMLKLWLCRWKTTNPASGKYASATEECNSATGCDW